MVTVRFDKNTPERNSKMIESQTFFIFLSVKDSLACFLLVNFNANML